MSSEIVAAARWLGCSIIAAACILVGGFHWSLSRLPKPPTISKDEMPAIRVLLEGSTTRPVLIGGPTLKSVEEIKLEISGGNNSRPVIVNSANNPSK